MPTPIMPDYVTNANVIKPQSNVADLFDQLKGYLSVSPDQLKKVLPILKDYDKKAIVIKTVNENNAAKLKQETDKLNSATVPKLKEVISQEQLNGLVLAMAMQENILSGKNITPQQKQLIIRDAQKRGENVLSEFAKPQQSGIENALVNTPEHLQGKKNNLFKHTQVEANYNRRS